MSEYAWISLISLTGCLVLALSSYRAHRTGVGRTAVLMIAWGAIFLLVAGIFAAVGG